MRGVNKQMALFVHRNIPRRAVEFFASNESGEYLLPVVVAVSPRDEAVETDPFLSLSADETQGLIDELWKAGFRPTEVGTAGQLSAVEDHLQDMRSLVFDTLLPIVERPPFVFPKPSAFGGVVKVGNES